MKKQLPIYVLVVLMTAAIFLSASTYQQKGKNDKNSNAQNQGRGNQKDKDKIQPGRQAGTDKGQPKVKPGNAADKENPGNGRNNSNKENKGNDKIFNDGPGNRDKSNRGKVKLVNLNGNDNNWYNWTNDNFKDRKQFRNKEKVTICHKFNSNQEPVTISVSANAVEAHRKHGDIIGGCPAVNNSVFSDIFRKRRADYYNDLYYAQDQYNYSSSILDYALLRLSNSRSQLDDMRANNASQADIDNRQVAVLQLEENVSLLETLLGVAGQVLVNRL